MAWILIHKRCKFGEKIWYNSRDIEFFIGDYFFGSPCIFYIMYYTVYCIVLVQM